MPTSETILEQLLATALATPAGDGTLKDFLLAPRRMQLGDGEQVLIPASTSLQQELKDFVRLLFDQTHPQIDNTALIGPAASALATRLNQLSDANFPMDAEAALAQLRLNVEAQLASAGVAQTETTQAAGHAAAVKAMVKAAMEIPTQHVAHDSRQKPLTLQEVLENSRPPASRDTIHHARRKAFAHRESCIEQGLKKLAGLFLTDARIDTADSITGTKRELYSYLYPYAGEDGMARMEAAMLETRNTLLAQAPQVEPKGFVARHAARSAPAAQEPPPMRL